MTMKKSRRAFLADLLFLSGGLTAAALLVSPAGTEDAEETWEGFVSEEELDPAFSVRNWTRERKPSGFGERPEVGDYWSLEFTWPEPDDGPHTQGIYRRPD
jgi:hypothetical protein